MRKINIIFSATIFLLVSCNQNMEDLNEENILKSRNIYTLAEDSHGHLYFGGYKFGLGIYDGTDFNYLDVNDGLYSNTIRSLYKDIEGRIWIGTNEGLNYFESGTIHKVETMLVGVSVSSIIEDLEDNIWFGTYEGLYKFDGASWDYFNEEQGLVHSFIEDLAIDRNGHIWIATYDGISKYDGTSWITYSSLFDRTINTLKTEYIPDVAVDFENNIWAITWGGGLLNFDGTNWHTFNEGDGLANNYGRAVVVDNSGRIIVGTKNGISIFDSKTWENKDFGSEIKSLFISAKETIWIGTYENGIFRFDN
jgi:ligand-binding sensor domain-containing protein